MTARPTIIFVGSHSRSGSTILGRVLGQQAGCFSVGELRDVWTLGMKHGHRCSCGALFRECEYWSAVFESAFGGFEEARPANLANALMVVDRNRYIPRLLSKRLRSTQFEDTLTWVGDQLGAFYTAMSSVSNCPILIDTSKDPSYGYLLRALFGHRVKVVHLVRDSRGVAFSWTRARIRPEVSLDLWETERMAQFRPWVTALRWDALNALIEGLRMTGDYMRIRYEDFVQHPVTHIHQLQALWGSTDPPQLPMTQGLLDLTAGHTIGGNPMRFQSGKIPFSVDDEWRTEMPARTRRAVSLLTAPVLAHYRYHL